jgi:hypothetical protein
MMSLKLEFAYGHVFSGLDLECFPGREREKLAEMDACVSFTERLSTLELSVKSTCLHPIFGPAFTSLSPLSVVSAKERNLI